MGSQAMVFCGILPKGNILPFGVREFVLVDLLRNILLMIISANNHISYVLAASRLCLVHTVMLFGNGIRLRRFIPAGKGRWKSGCPQDLLDLPGWDE